MQKPVFSIIVAIEKSENICHKALASIIGQTFQNFEILIISNRPLTPIPVYKDPPINLIINKSLRSEILKWNYGLQVANGKYICILYPEVISEPNRLEKQYEFMESHPRTGIVGSAVKQVNTNSGQISIINDRQANGEIIKPGLLVGEYIQYHSVIMRTKYLRKFNLRFDIKMGSAAGYDLIAKGAGHFQTTNLKEPLISRNKFPKSGDDQDNARIAQLQNLHIRPSQTQISLHKKLINNRHLSLSELHDAEKWLNKLLFKNYLLKVYNQSQLYRIFDVILTQATQKEKIGGWSIEKGMIEYILKNLAVGSKILEFGSGDGTDALLEHYKVISVEHDPNFYYNHTKDHLCFFAPISKEWYKKESVKKALSQDFDLVLVDGPPGELRKGILKNIALFKGLTIPFIFDDIDREIDKQTMVSFCNKMKYEFQIISSGTKLFAFCKYCG